MKRYESIGVAVPNILLPKSGTDMHRYAVVACDQYSSEPAYWERVAAEVGDQPSTLRLIYPEAFLSAPDREAREAEVNAKMASYLESGFFEAKPGMIYVERMTTTGLRRGLVVALDLEAYDFSAGSQSLVRATEGTIADRLPPRVRIRREAPLELPHIMVLIDDAAATVIEPLGGAKAELEPVYDFDLMEEGGHIAGWRLPEAASDRVAEALSKLADPLAFMKRYGLEDPQAVLLYAMGDGNHSLATAKVIYEELKAKDPKAAKESPLRYALVELVNLHDDSLVFEPIHRLLFGLKDLKGPMTAFANAYEDRFRYQAVGSFEAMVEQVRAETPSEHRFGVVRQEGFGVATVSRPEAGLSVGTLQNVLDRFMKAGEAREIDYVHGDKALIELATHPGDIGFYLAPTQKQDLFRAVIQDGALPRKTFSMGEAQDKRFYLEARALQD